MDKDIALIISEMLIKQDETTDQIIKTNNYLAETNDILKNFMAVTIGQFEQQQKFNERFESNWEKQQKFNERVESELRDIKTGVNKLVNLEERLKAIEERENNLENRVANIERLLKAS